MNIKQAKTLKKGDSLVIDETGVVVEFDSLITSGPSISGGYYGNGGTYHPKRTQILTSNGIQLPLKWVSKNGIDIKEFPKEVYDILVAVNAIVKNESNKHSANISKLKKAYNKLEKIIWNHKEKLK